MTTCAADIEALWHEYHESLFRYVKRRVSQQETIDDIVQTVYIRALSAIRRGKGANEHEKGWMYRIAHNAIIDYYMMRDRTPELIELDDLVEDRGEEGDLGNRTNAEILTSTDLTPHELFERTTIQNQVREAVNQLSEWQAWSISLRMEGFENDEIAEIASKDVRAIRQINTRAYAKLRELLSEAA